MSKYTDVIKLFTTFHYGKDCSKSAPQNLSRQEGMNGKMAHAFQCECEVVHIGRRNQNFSYTLRDPVLSVLEQEKDVGCLWTAQ